MALTYTPQGALGSPLPSFRLPGVDGKTYSEHEFANAKALLVMFICNHCPYVVAVEDRLLELARRTQDKGAKFLAICANDPTDHPDDHFDELRKRWQTKSYPFPYLQDLSQSTAKAFGAVCTPDFFLYDSNQKLAYRGRLDDSWKNPEKVTRRELESAIEALLAGGRPPTDQVPSMGCSIKWKHG